MNVFQNVYIYINLKQEYICFYVYMFVCVYIYVCVCVCVYDFFISLCSFLFQLRIQTRSKTLQQYKKRMKELYPFSVVIYMCYTVFFLCTNHVLVPPPPPPQTIRYAVEQ